MPTSIVFAAGEELTFEAFTGQFVTLSREKHPECTFEIVAPGEVDLECGETSGRLRLYAAFDTYNSGQSSLDELVEKRFRALYETLHAPDSQLIEYQIVPMVRAAEFAAQFREVGTEPLIREMNSELAVFYAIDRENSLAYLTGRDIYELGLDTTGLFEQAMFNLEIILGSIYLRNEDPPMDGPAPIWLDLTGGRYGLVAGGDYESSLLLLDWLWKSPIEDVVNDYVVAVMHKDVVMACDRSDTVSVAFLRDLLSHSDYSISNRLFMRTDGKWVVFEP